MKGIVTIALLIVIAGCSPSDRAQLSGLGSSLLGQAGFNVSSTQLDTMFEAGDKINKAARGLTPEQEYYLGRGVAAVILGKYPLLRNASLNSYLTKICRALAAGSERPQTFSGYHCAALNTDEVNALAAPGGFIFVTKGFLKLMPDEDALAAVLAHEVSHVVLGHGTAAISQSHLTSALTLLGKEAAMSQGGSLVQEITAHFGDSISDVTETLLTKGYSRSQEYAADEMGARLLARAGYAPDGSIAMLEALHAKSGSEGGWYSTHPSAEDRIDNLDGELPSVQSVGRELRAQRFARLVN